MLAEIVFLVALKENNPRMWIRSFPFHFGIYLVSAATFVMIGASILVVISPTILAGGFGTFVKWVLVLSAVGGLSLGILGALGLLQNRLTHPDYKDFSTPADIFNLVFFIVAFGVALAFVLIEDREMAMSMGFVYTLVTFKTSALGDPGAFFMLTVVLLGALIAYIPLTHMSHFVGKYFAYHAIRWNDDPNLRGGKHEKAIGEVLNYPVSWSAPHIQGNGKKTWAEVATAPIATEEKGK
jgi:nitrate reductase gamma subunit